MLAPVLLLVALTASAEKLPDCIHVSTATAKLRYKPDLDSVRECQDKVRQRLIDEAGAKGKPLSEKRLEKIDDAQRAEVREYLAHSGFVIDGESKNGRKLEDAPPAESADLGGLEKRLHAAAGDGKDGISPGMARDILDTLTKKQGSVSPEMKDLLDAVARDGGKLTPETMKKLQGAGRASKGQGLDLGIDKGIEKELLERDFDQDQGLPPDPRAAPGNL